MNARRILVAAAVSMLIVAPAAAQNLRGETMTGRMVIRDGDSFQFFPGNDGDPLEFRLFGVDAPEMRNTGPWGMLAREYFRWITSFKIDVECTVLDRAGRRGSTPRWAVTCQLPPGYPTDQGEPGVPFAVLMLRAGYAWQDTRFLFDGVTDGYGAAEAAARDARAGMWQLYDGP